MDILRSKPFVYSLGVIGLIIGLTWLIKDAGASSLQDVAQSTYKLYGENRPHCSSVAVSENQLVTAAHCVDKIKTLNIRQIKEDEEFNTLSYNTYVVETVRVLKDKDVAFLELMDKDIKLPTYVDIAETGYVNDYLTLGAELHAVGYPKTDELTITKGEYTAKAPLPSLKLKGPYYKTTVPITGGSSGGGLYIKDGSDYKLIGLTTAGYRDVSFMSYFSPIESLKEVTKFLLNGTKPQAQITQDLKQSEMKLDSQ